MQIDHTKNIIEVKNVSFSYDNDIILDKISFNVHQGDYLGIVGPNGGGKTTLLKIMLGLLRPSTGVVTIFGSDIQHFNTWSKIGYVPQKAVHFDSNFPATVYEVVSMGRYGRIGLFHSLNSTDKDIIDESLRQVDMYEYKNRIIGDLSGGQQQRVFIARALVSEPEIIFLDEPTVGVDVNTQESFYKLLKKLNQTLSLTLILVSHDIDMVAHESTEIACVNKTLNYDSCPVDLLKTEKLHTLYGHQAKFITHNH